MDHEVLGGPVTKQETSGEYLAFYLTLMMALGPRPSRPSRLGRSQEASHSVQLDPDRHPMDSRKRKREDEIPRPSNKIIRNHLSKRYEQRVRDIPEVLMNGANLDVGHVVGTLEAIGRDGDALTFEIKDDRDKILVCQFAAPHLRLDNNRAIEKPIELAIKAACRYPLDNPGNNKYSFKLLFDQFQFVLGGQLYMDDTGMHRIIDRPREGP
jgi:hypothetical protein